MNTNKIWTRLLMASALLALLLTTACSQEKTIKDPAEQALSEQGSIILSVLHGGDSQAVHGIMSIEAQAAMDKANRLAGGWVDVEEVIMQAAASLAGWKFEDARIFVKGGSIRGTLDGTVKYINGKPGKVHMELEQEAGAWKLRNINLETEAGT